VVLEAEISGAIPRRPAMFIDPHAHMIANPDDLRPWHARASSP
jgi:hypothetical protein